MYCHRSIFICPVSFNLSCIIKITFCFIFIHLSVLYKPLQITLYYIYIEVKSNSTYFTLTHNISGLYTAVTVEKSFVIVCENDSFFSSMLLKLQQGRGALQEFNAYLPLIQFSPSSSYGLQLSSLHLKDGVKNVRLQVLKVFGCV